MSLGYIENFFQLSQNFFWSKKLQQILQVIPCLLFMYSAYKLIKCALSPSFALLYLTQFTCFFLLLALATKIAIIFSFLLQAPCRTLQAHSIMAQWCLIAAPVFFFLEIKTFFLLDKTLCMFLHPIRTVCITLWH